MNTDEAVVKLKEMRDALFQGEMAIEITKDYKAQVDNLKEKVKELKEGIKQKTLELRDENILLNSYIEKFGRLFQICDICKGEGGFRYGEHDEEYEECSNCKGYGVIEIG